MRYKEAGKIKGVDVVETAAKPQNITTDGSHIVLLVLTLSEVCPKCDHNEIAYDMIQTRSADEPATIFYTCTKCNHKWKEG
jgi:DNA-directed RNA polymerase subunit M/transcription elongation factor TFIIS